MDNNLDTRSRVVFVLEQLKGKFISGEMLATELGISRNAVWKHIESLRKEGYPITSVKKRGYMLENTSDKISPIGIHGILNGVRCKTEVLKTVDSTILHLMRRGAEGACEWTIATAEEQTRGKGKYCAFYSPPGDGLYVSILLRPNIRQEGLLDFSHIFSLATLYAIERTAGIRLMSNNQNDIFFENKKVAGLLTDASVSCETGNVQYVVSGIGINVHSRSREFGTKNMLALDLINKMPFDRNTLIAKLLEGVAVYYGILKSRGISVIHSLFEEEINAR